MNSQQATVTVYDGMRPIRVTGKIVKRYPNGAITLDDARGVRHFASPDRIHEAEPELKGLLF